MFRKGDPRSFRGPSVGSAGSGSTQERSSPGASPRPRGGSDAPPQTAEVRIHFEDVASVLVQDRMWELLLSKDVEAVVTRGDAGAMATHVSARDSDRHLLIRMSFKSSAVAEAKGAMLAAQDPLRGRVLLADGALLLCVRACVCE